MDDYGFGTYVDDAQVYDPSFNNGYEDPWSSAQTGATDFLGPAEEMQFEGFDSSLTGDSDTTFFPDSSGWDSTDLF